MTDWEARCRRLEAENEKLLRFLDWVLDAKRADDVEALSWANDTFLEAERVREALAVSTSDEKEE